MSYADKLKDPRWQKKRLEIFERDNFTCQLCMDTKTTLVAHHKKYIYGRDIYDYPNEFLITLCKTCHDKFHEKIYDDEIIEPSDLSHLIDKDGHFEISKRWGDLCQD